MNRLFKNLIISLFSLTTACASSHAIRPPGEKSRTDTWDITKGPVLVQVTNDVQDTSVVTFVDVIDPCGRIHWRLTIGQTRPVFQFKVACRYTSQTESAITVKAYKVGPTKKDTSYVGLVTKTYPYYSSYPSTTVTWIVTSVPE